MPSTPPPIDDLLLERYIAGEATPDECVAVEDWAALSPENAQHLADMRLFWGGASVAPSVDIERALIRVKRPAALHVTPSNPFAAGGSRWAIRRAIAVMGATIAAGLAALMVVRAGSLGVPAHLARQYTAARGQRESVTLPDGTHFTLAPDSRLRLGADFSSGARDAYLEGEAFFVVRHDPTHPFAVHVAGAIVRDVGTQFDVRAYADDASAQVVVAQGEVAFGAVTMRAGDRGIIRGTQVSIVHDADVNALTGWTRGELSFHDAPLARVAADLGRWYGVEIDVADPSLAQMPVTATIDDESLTGALDLIAPTVGARYVRRDQMVTIYSAIHISPLTR